MGTLALDIADVPHGALLVMDSAPIIYLMEEAPGFVDRYRPLLDAQAAGRVQFAVSAITLAEVMTGPLRKRQEATAERHRAILESWRVVPVDAEIAASAARMRAAHGLRLPDAVQVATALAVNAYALITADRDFSRVTELRILS